MTSSVGGTDGDAGRHGGETEHRPEPAARAGVTAGRPDGLRVVSWNVRDLLGDPLAVHRVLRALAPDVACLQEVPRRPTSRWQAASLARATGLLHVAGGRASGGTALLVSLRAEVGRHEAFRLPVRGRTTRTRGAVVAELGLPGTARVAVACVHLGLDPDERLRHAAEVAHRAAGPASGALPLVVAGDLNEPVSGPSWTAFGPDVVDRRPDAPPTFPAAAPRRRIDAVLIGPGVDLLDPAADDAALAALDADIRAASDHRPVVAVLRLQPR